MTETIRIEIPVEVADKTEPEVSNLVKKLTKFDESTEKTQQKLSKLGGGIKQLAGRAWNITMKAKDMVTAPVRGILNLLKNPVFQAGAILGVSIGLKDTIDTYKGFEAAMSQVQAVSGATGSELDQLTAKAKEMGATTKFTAAESAEAFNYMAMAGWKTEEMLGGIEGILNLAAASGESLATTSDIVTDALTAFGMQASDAGHFSDVMAAASSNANTNVSLMGETFKYAGAMAGTLGYSIEDVALATGLMANAGIKGNMAGTALNSIFTRLSTNTNGAADALRKMGIEVFNADGSARKLSDVLGELRTATADYTDKQKASLGNTVAGTYAQKGFLAILNATEKDYEKLTDAVNNADGAAANMAETMLDNLAGSMTILQSAVDGVKLSFGERLSPYVRGIAEWLTAQMPAVESGLSDFMDFVDRKIEKLQKKFEDITSGENWKNADLFGKVKIAWDEFIVEPFSEWWNGTGKANVAGIAADIGEGLGSGLRKGIMTLLGIDVSGTIDEGASVGAAFARGFSEGFDVGAITEKLGEVFKKLFSNAGKLLPGGESAGLSSVLSAMLLAKIASPLIHMGMGTYSLGRTLTTPGAGGVSPIGSLIGSAAAGTGIKGGLASLGILGAKLTSTSIGGFEGLLGTQAAGISGGGLIAAGALGAGGAIAGGLSVVSGGIDAYKAVKSDDADGKSAYGTSAGLKIGGAAAGAAIGTLILPGLGTAIGAGIGGIAGYFAGNKVKKAYEDELKEAEEAAAKAQKVFDATGLSMDKVKFETAALNDAVNDTSVSAEELGLMFQEAVNDDLKSRFGDISLSLAEIKELAGDIVFGEQAKELEGFSAAAVESESSFAALEKRMQGINRLNWRASLGVELSESGIEEYKSAMDSLVEEAKTYAEDRHYETASAINLLVGSDKGQGLMFGLDTMYGGLQSHLDSVGEVLNRVASEALSDGVISTVDKISFRIGDTTFDMDEASAVRYLQEEISGITEKVTAAQSEAKLDVLKVRYGGAKLDIDSFVSMQEEIAADVESTMAGYDQALELSLTSLHLQYQSGAIDQNEFDRQSEQLIAGYEAKVNDLKVNVESFQIGTIADSFGQALDGILPDIQGTTAEKLSEAMNQALAENPNVASWTQDDVTSWFGLESLSTEIQNELFGLLQAAAGTIPENMRSSIVSAVESMDYSDIDFIGPCADAASEQIVEKFNEIECSEAGASVVSGVGEAIQNADRTEINSAITSLKESTDASVDAAFSAGVSTTMPVNITLDYNILNPTQTITASGNGVSGSTTVSVTKNAAGGYVSGGPMLSWLAEEGYGEFVIPTNPSRRMRALELYEQAGKVLGVDTNADGGFVGGRMGQYSGSTNNTSDSYAPIAASGENSVVSQSVQVNVQMAPEIVIQGGDGQDAEGIAEVIRRHIREMADELGGEIASQLEGIFSNMPLQGA